MRLVERIGVRVLVAVVVAVTLALLRSADALPATIAPAACNLTMAAGEDPFCDVTGLRGEKVVVQLRVVGTTANTAFTQTVRALDPDGNQTPTTALAADGNSAQAFQNGSSPVICGTDICQTRSFTISNHPALRIELANSSATAGLVLKTWVHYEDATVELADPLPVTVGNFPATQPVSGTVACSNCAGGGGGEGGGLTSIESTSVQGTAWGVWALVGLTFVLIAAPRWFRAFRVTHGS